jgi:nucleoside-diphosphate-sugar epimerase
MKALVTGGSGFIGSHIVDALDRHGHQVVALVRRSSDTSHLKQTRAELAIGDVTDSESLVNACRGVDWVFHTAAVVDNAGPWQRYFEIGVQGTRNVVEAAIGANVKRFVHISSGAVYGMPARGRTYTEDCPLQPRQDRWNHYAREKVLTEQIILEAIALKRLRATIIRPSIVIGPRDRTVAPGILKLLQSPVACMIGDANNRVPLIVVEELAEACINAAQSSQAEGRCYNLSGRNEIRQRDMVEIFAAITGLPVPRFRVPMGAAMVAAALVESIWKLVGGKGEAPLTRTVVVLGGDDMGVDSSRARNELGWVGDNDYKGAFERYFNSER